GDFHDLAKGGAGTLPLELRACDVAAAARAAFDVAAPQAKAKGIAFELDVRGEGALEAKCDRARVMQILSKLIGNAIKFTAEGGKIALSIGASVEAIELAVEDSGKGIAPERRATVFD